MASKGKCSECGKEEKLVMFDDKPAVQKHWVPAERPGTYAGGVHMSTKPAGQILCIGSLQPPR